MKYQKKFILVFALFWVIGLFGGYFLGVGSAIVPKENIEYNYYFSEKINDSSVESISTEGSDDNEAENETTFLKTIKSINIFSIPKRVIQHLFSPSASNQPKIKSDLKKKLA